MNQSQPATRAHRTHKTSALVAAACLLLASGMAHARPIGELFKTGETPRIEVSNVNGEIEVTTWSRGEVELTGELDDRAELVLEHDKDSLIIRVVKKDNQRRIGDTTLVLQVPPAAELSLHSVSGDVTTENVTGVQRIDVVSGDTDVSDFGADLDINSVSGDITAIGQGNDTVVKVLAVSGDVDLSRLAGEAEVTTVSGESTVSGGVFTRVRMNTTSGGIAFDGDIQDKGRFEAETISGDVEISLGQDSRIDVNVETFTGNIASCFTEQPQRKSKYAPGKILVFERDDASKDIRVETMSGDVDLCAR